MILDGEGSSTRRYRCTSDTGELTNTERVMADWKFLWRRCIGQQVFGLALSGFLLQVVFRSVQYCAVEYKSNKNIVCII